MNKYRVEIIANQAVQEDLFERFHANDTGHRYSIISPAFGKGSSGERMGDHIWPEENCIILMYCDEDEYKKIRRSVLEVKQLFTNEGIKMFAARQDFEEI
ncbi:PG0541 family transporter-associated protein [Spirochaeta dissipatitropha]